MSSIIQKLKANWIVISSALVAGLYFLLTLSKSRYKDAKLELEQVKLQKELAKVKTRASIDSKEADSAKENYKKLLDRHPHLKSELD